LWHKGCDRESERTVLRLGGWKAATYPRRALSIGSCIEPLRPARLTMDLKQFAAPSIESIRPN